MDENAANEYDHYSTPRPHLLIFSLLENDTQAHTDTAVGYVEGEQHAHPNRLSTKTIIGMNSKKKSRLSLKYAAFIPLRHTPNVIWMTPMITDIFIFIELKNRSCQMDNGS